MASKRGVINQNTVIAEHTVVANVHVCHQQIVVTDSGVTAILNGTAMNRDTLANNIVVTDHQTRWLTFVLEVRGIFLDGRKLKDLIVLTDNGWAFYNNMRCDHSARANFDIWTDNRPGADRDIRRQFG